MPAATADDAPPLEPPGVCSRDQGLSVRPCRSFSVNQRTEKAGVLVRPMITAPARRRLATTGLSSVAMLSLKATTPLVVARPLQVDVDLHRHRHAVQRAQRIAAAARGIGRIGRGQRLVGQQVDDGVERRVDGLHALQAGLCRFARGEGAAADGGGEALGGPGPQGVGHVVVFPSLFVPRWCDGCLRAAAGCPGQAGRRGVDAAVHSTTFTSWPGLGFLMRRCR